MNDKAFSFLAVMSPGAASIAARRESDPHIGASLVPGVAAGVAGYCSWKAHPVLGFLGAEAIGLNAARIIRGQGNDRKTAGCNLFVAAAGIVGSLMWKKHPFFGWWVGHIAGAAATAIVPGSNADNLVKSFR